MASSTPWKNELLDSACLWPRCLRDRGDRCRVRRGTSRREPRAPPPFSPFRAVRSSRLGRFRPCPVPREPALMGPSSGERRKDCESGVDLPARALEPSGGLLRRSLWAVLVPLRSGRRGRDDDAGIHGLFLGRGGPDRRLPRSGGQSGPRVRYLRWSCVPGHRLRVLGNTVSRVVIRQRRVHEQRHQIRYTHVLIVELK